MADTNPRSWIGKTVSVCFGILFGAVALYIAVKLVEAVAEALLIIIGTVVFVAIGYALMRARNNGW